MLSNRGLENNSNQLNFVQDDLFIKCRDIIHNVMQPIQAAFSALLNFGSMRVKPMLEWLSGRVLDCKVVGARFHSLDWSNTRIEK